MATLPSEALPWPLVPLTVDGARGGAGVVEVPVEVLAPDPERATEDAPAKLCTRAATLPRTSSVPSSLRDDWKRTRTPAEGFTAGSRLAGTGALARESWAEQHRLRGVTRLRASAVGNGAGSATPTMPGRGAGSSCLGSFVCCRVQTGSPVPVQQRVFCACQGLPTRRVNAGVSAVEDGRWNGRCVCVLALQRLYLWGRVRPKRQCKHLKVVECILVVV